MNSGISHTAREFVGFFQKLNVPYALIGGFAVRAHAIPRPTWDVDFVVELTDEQLAKLIEEAEEQGYQVDESVKSGWIEKVREMPVIKFKLFIEGGKIDIDLFLSDSSFLRQILARRVLSTELGIDAFVITPEDLILMKLMAHRRKDQADVQDIFFVQGQLDVAYLRLWADRLNVRSRLEEFLGELG